MQWDRAYCQYNHKRIDCMYGQTSTNGEHATTLRINTSHMYNGDKQLHVTATASIKDTLYSQAAQENFKLTLVNYSLAAELNKKSEAIQVTTLLTDIAKEAWPGPLDDN